MLRVGLTGGIGSGKSEVARLLWATVPPDRRGRRRPRGGRAGYAGLRPVRRGLRPDGRRRRRDPRPAGAGCPSCSPTRSLLAALNAIVHPLVGARTAELVAAGAGDAVVVNDVPLLVENGLQGSYDLVVVVDAPGGRAARAARRPRASHRPRPGRGWRLRHPARTGSPAPTTSSTTPAPWTTSCPRSTGCGGSSRPPSTEPGADAVSGLSAPLHVALGHAPHHRPRAQGRAVRGGRRLQPQRRPARGDRRPRAPDPGRRARRRAARRHRHRQVGDHGLADRAGAAARRS